MAKSLLKDGHDIHVFARESTRVVHNGKSVLSKNQDHVQDLVTALGVTQVSRMHCHTAKAHVTDQLLAQTDSERLGRFASVYVPDALVFCIDELISQDDALFGAASKAADGALQFYLRWRSDDSSWLFETGSNGITLLPLGSAMHDFIGTHLLGRLDPHRSQDRLEKVLSTHSCHLLAKTPLISGAKVANPSVSNAGSPIVNSKIRVSATQGEIESLKDGEVVFSELLWIKGWVDFSLPQLKCLVININDQAHRCFPQAIRGELAERHRNSNILGFEAHLPIAEEGPRLKISIALMTDDGREHPWKKIFVWGDRAVPPRYKTPVVRGHASFSSNDQLHCICGALAIDGYAVRSLRVIQFGRTIAQQSIEPAVSNVEFIFPLSPSEMIDARGPVHLWLGLEGIEEVFWLHVFPPDNAASSLNSTLSFDGVAEGDVLHGMDVTIQIKANPEARLASLFLNGVEEAQCALRSGQGELCAPLGKHANGLLVEVRDDTGGYAKRLVWRYLDEPAGRTHQTLISLPSGRGSAQMATVTANNTKRVVVIRRAPAPTDELYILAPLRKLVAKGTLHLEIIDTDTGELDSVAYDRILQPGTHVIASRYVTDELVQRLTAKRSTLGSIFYLMDDDVVGAEDSRWLPGGYRTRMMRVAHGEFQAMLALCDHFVVTCEFLKQRYASQKTDLLDPPYLHPPSNLNHLRDVREIVIAYHGTMVHRDDINAISPALREVHDKYDHVRIQIVMGDYVPSMLKGLPRVEIIPAMPWDDYKKFIERSRAHIGLSPILKTPYNLGKSVVKIMDICALGAVGIYTASEPYAKYVRSGENGFLLENDPLIWQKTISWLIEHPQELCRMAIAGQELARRVGDIGRLEAYWRVALNLEPSRSI